MYSPDGSGERVMQPSLQFLNGAHFLTMTFDRLISKVCHCCIMKSEVCVVATSFRSWVSAKTTRTDEKKQIDRRMFIGPQFEVCNAFYLEVTANFLCQHYCLLWSWPLNHRSVTRDTGHPPTNFGGFLNNFLFYEQALDGRADRQCTLHNVAC